MADNRVRTSARFSNLKDKDFNRWHVVSFVENRVICGKTYPYWLCRCACGKERSVNAESLVRRLSESCGCLATDRCVAALTKHGMAHTSEYNVWAGMLARCHNENSTGYHKYGAKGISVCDEWGSSFEAFFADMGLKPTAKHTIERNDGTKGYCKDNCSWETQKTQQRNRSNNRLITYRGVTKCLAAWAEDIGIGYGTLRLRLEKWSIEKAFTTPVDRSRTNDIKHRQGGG